jgi:hypothetical protein
MTTETREDAKQRILELTAEMMATKGRAARRPLMLEQARLVALKATLPSRVDLAAQRAPKPAGRAPKEAPPPYAGPRCGYCGGEQPPGERCRNESEDWPHPPYKTPIKENFDAQTT